MLPTIESFFVCLFFTSFWVQLWIFVTVEAKTDADN